MEHSETIGTSIYQYVEVVPDHDLKTENHSSSRSTQFPWPYARSFIVHAYCCIAPLYKDAGRDVHLHPLTLHIGDLRVLAMANGEFVAYLPQSSGYGIILGGGFAFAILMLALTWLQSKFTAISPFQSM